MAKSDNAMICEKRGFVVGDVIQGAEDGHIAIVKTTSSLAPPLWYTKLL